MVDIKRANELLKLASERYPKKITNGELYEKGFDSQEINPLVRYLKGEGLIKHDSGRITATSQGVSKIEDDKINITKKIKQGPINTLLVLIAFVSLLTAGYYYNKSIGLEEEKTQIEKDKFKLMKPVLIMPEKVVKGGLGSQEFKFYVKNPTDMDMYIDKKGTCSPENTELLKKSSPKESMEESNSPNLDSTSNINIPSTYEPYYHLEPHKEISLNCEYDVYNPLENTNTKIQVCVIEKRFGEQCDSIPVTIIHQ